MLYEVVRETPGRDKASVLGNGGENAGNHGDYNCRSKSAGFGARSKIRADKRTERSRMKGQEVLMNRWGYHGEDVDRA